VKTRASVPEIPIEKIEKLMDKGYLPEDAGIEAQKRRASGDIEGATIALGIGVDMRKISRERILREIKIRVFAWMVVIGLLAFVAGFATQWHMRDERLTQIELWEKSDKEAVQKWEAQYRADDELRQRIEHSLGHPLPEIDFDEDHPLPPSMSLE
jgi:hypothetical protein